LGTRESENPNTRKSKRRQGSVKPDRYFRIQGRINMPALAEEDADGVQSLLHDIPFPPVTRDHILHCSYDYWFPKYVLTISTETSGIANPFSRYRTSCIRSRIVPLSSEFVSFLNEDGIVLADDEGDEGAEDDDWEPSVPTPGTRIRKDNDEEADEKQEDGTEARLPPNKRFPELHQTIKDRIAELGGAVCPKLNWSAPKDAAWISPHQNTLKCTIPNDVYLLLKSSNFINHDLAHAFDDCISTSTVGTGVNSLGLKFSPVLVLRSFFSLHPALEFRCFVKHRTLVAISSRDLNYYSFLRRLESTVISRIRELFERKLRYTFPDDSFIFDVYIPNTVHDESNEDGLGRARLIDINPWAKKTDALLFDWQELLALRVPKPLLGAVAEAYDSEEPAKSESDTTDGEEDDYEPELRIVEEADPAAYNFSSPQYSAHKLPRDVVDASSGGQSGMRDFAQRWQRMLSGEGQLEDWEGSDAED
jgi:hypothetical protein